MSQLKNRLFAFAGLALLATIGAIMNHHATAQDAGPRVTIQGPLPLPITGSATVSGSVAATQSGPWSVGISGLPLPVSLNGGATVSGSVSASQSGAWNVGIVGTPNVNVANTASAPLIARDADSPPRGAVQFRLWNPSPNGPESYTVPAGKILVIDDCSSFTPLPAVFSVTTTVNGDTQDHVLPVYAFPNGFGAYIGGRTMQVYAGPGTTVTGQINGGGGTGNYLSCSGHLVAQ